MWLKCLVDGVTSYGCLIQCISLREKRRTKNYLMGKSMVSDTFALKPIHWTDDSWCGLRLELRIASVAMARCCKSLHNWPLDLASWCLRHGGHCAIWHMEPWYHLGSALAVDSEAGCWVPIPRWMWWLFGERPADVGITQDRMLKCLVKFDSEATQLAPPQPLVLICFQETSLRAVSC